LVSTAAAVTPATGMVSESVPKVRAVGTPSSSNSSSGGGGGGGGGSCAHPAWQIPTPPPVTAGARSSRPLPRASRCRQSNISSISSST
jgi:hypothetical protein